MLTIQKSLAHLGGSERIASQLQAGSEYKINMNTNIADMPVNLKPSEKTIGSNPNDASKRSLDINEVLNSFIEIVDEMIREKGLAPTGFHIIEPGGIYCLSFDPGESYLEFLERILLICRARDLDFGLLIIPSLDLKRKLPGKLTDTEGSRLLIQVAFVVEDRHGQRIEKVLPVLRDVAGNLTGFGEYSAEFPDPIGRKYPRFMPNQLPTLAERMAARSALMIRGIKLNHQKLDAANKQAAQN